MPEDWLIFTDLVKKAIAGQNITSRPPVYNCIESVLIGEVTCVAAKENCTVEHYEIVMLNITKRTFHAFAYCNQKFYLSWYLCTSWYEGKSC